MLVRDRTSDRARGDNPCPSIKRLGELLTQAIASAELDDEVAREFKDCFLVCLFTTREGYLGVSAKDLHEGKLLYSDLPLVTHHRTDI